MIIDTDVLVALLKASRQPGEYAITTLSVVVTLGPDGKNVSIGFTFDHSASHDKLIVTRPDIEQLGRVLTGRYLMLPKSE